MSSHYNPNQPRVPAGHEGAGRWSDGESATARILNSPLLDRDRLIKAALGIRNDDKHEGKVHLALFDPRKPTTRPLLPRIPLKPGLLIPLKRAPYIGAALSLYSLLSQFDDDEQQAVIAFRRKEFRRGSDDQFDLEGIQLLQGWAEIEKVCGKAFVERIQKFVDDAYDKVKKEGKPLSPQEFGTEVHKRVENKIKALGNPKFGAEITYEKDPPSDRNKAERRGAKRSIRMDALYRRNKETLCVADVKTGDKPLGFEYMREIVRRASVRDPAIKRIVVIEARPRNAPVRKQLPTLQSE